MMQTSEVFGISPNIKSASYVDRGLLDNRLKTLLGRTTHIAIRGESKCGKSWLRQKIVGESIVVQCRHGKTLMDIYRDALAKLDIKLTINGRNTRKISGHVEAAGEFGFGLLSKLGLRARGAAEKTSGQQWKPIGKDVNDLAFVADIIKASNKRLIIEDFHYLSIDERKAFAFDLKALWDYEVYIVIIGVWSQTNMILSLNPDLTGRIEEISVSWKEDELKQVLEKGGKLLNIEFAANVKEEAAAYCFGNVGIIQHLALSMLDDQNITEKRSSSIVISDCEILRNAAMQYAEQLNPLYQKFAKDVAEGIRKRSDSTGIYSHSMSIIFDSDDQTLMNGLDVDAIFELAHSKEPRIQKGNLKKILEKIESLQVDEDGRGLIISYNPSREEVTVVDRQVLLYRKFATIKWPWETLIAESKL